MQLLAGRGFMTVSGHENFTFNVYFYNPCNVVIEDCNSFIGKDAKLILKPVVVYIKISIYGSTSLVEFGSFSNFLILYTVGRTPWKGDQPVARPLPTHRTTQTQNKRTQTYMT
jgi:hypothetical protein